MAHQIGLQWPIDEAKIANGIAIYASGDKAKQLLAASNGHEFRLEGGRIITADPSGEYSEEAGRFAERLSTRSPRPNRYRALCRIEPSKLEGYDVCIVTYPGNRVNLDGVIDAITQTLYPLKETVEIVRVERA